MHLLRIMIEGIAFGYISVMYDRSALVHGANRSPSQYVCYDDRRLGGLHWYAPAIYDQLYQCNTILHNDDHFCASPRMYLYQALI
jgi:hypothetical protein